MPPPTGVVRGPLMATRCWRMVSRVASGSQLPVSLNAFSPARISSHSTRRSEEHTSELQSQSNLVCRLLLEKKKKNDPSHCGKQQQSSAHPSTQPTLKLVVRAYS